MIVVISHRTMALALYLSPVRKKVLTCERYESMKGVGAPQMDFEEASFLREWLGVDEKLCLLAPSEKSKRRTAYFFSRTCYKGLPSKILVHLGGEVFGVCPELCFLQMASELTLPQLIRFGYDLCGKYAPGYGSKDTRYNLEPITTVKKIKKFLNQCKKVHGVSKAFRALKYVRDISASPRESIIAAMYAMPFSMGGFNAPDFEMNKRFEESREDRFPDLYWPNCSVDIEYDSDEFHDDKTRDAIRKNELLAANVRVLTVTKEMLNSPHLTYGLALDFYGNAGRKFRPTCRDYNKKRAALHKELSQDWYKMPSPERYCLPERLEKDAEK